MLLTEMHSSGHRIPGSGCSLKCVSARNIRRTQQILSHHERARFRACCLHAGTRIPAQVQEAPLFSLFANGTPLAVNTTEHDPHGLCSKPTVRVLSEESRSASRRLEM